jgi:RNA polymerase subunit RPABC4/transcription elongation factor Spt4
VNGAGWHDTSLLACANCGRLVSWDFVALMDYCPGCAATPFPEGAE